MPESRVGAVLSGNEVIGPLRFVCVASDGVEMSWICREVHRCWCWRLCRIWRVVAEKGLPDAEADSMSLLSAEGSGQGCSNLLVVMLGVLRWELSVIESGRGFGKNGR